MNLKKAIITGSSGYLGTQLIKTLNRNNIECFCVTSNKDISHGIFLDTWNTNSLEKVLEKIQPDCIFNLRGTYKKNVSGSILFQINCIDSISLLQAQVNLKLRIPTILLGSAAEYGELEQEVKISEDEAPRPCSLYGLSKLAQTRAANYYIQVHHLPIIVARVFNLIGPQLPLGLAPSDFLFKVENSTEKSVEINGSSSVRDYVHVEDVCNILLLLMQNPKAMRKTVNICSGKGIKIGELFEKLLNASGQLDKKIVLSKSNDKPSYSIGSRRLLDELAPNYIFKSLDAAIKSTALGGVCL